MTVKDITIRDAVTSDQTVSILTHLAAAAFGGWAFVVKYSQQIKTSGICNSIVLQGTEQPCLALARWQHSLQLELAGAGLALIVAAACIELYKQESHDQ